MPAARSCVSWDDFICTGGIKNALSEIKTAADSNFPARGHLLAAFSCTLKENVFVAFTSRYIELEPGGIRLLAMVGMRYFSPAWAGAFPVSPIASTVMHQRTPICRSSCLPPGFSSAAC